MNKSVRTVAVLALCAALLLAVQVAMAPLPNIELVSLLVMLFTLAFRHKVLYIIYVFVVLEGVIYGFHIWWISYVYVWTLLALLTWLCRGAGSPWLWAVVSGAFGLIFGALCAIPYLFAGGPAMALSYWLSGLLFDLVHCAANFVLCLVLWKPLRKTLTFCTARI